MPLIEWTESMSVGVPLLDADHREFIRLVNELDSNAEYAERRDVIRNTLNTLEDYANFHFSREESVMQACGFPELDDHAREHDEFRKYVRDISRRFESDPTARMGKEVLEYLKRWLRHHILVQDMAYRPYAEGNAEADAAARNFQPLYMDAF